MACAGAEQQNAAVHAASVGHSHRQEREREDKEHVVFCKVFITVARLVEDQDSK